MKKGFTINKKITLSKYFVAINLEGRNDTFRLAIQNNGRTTENNEKPLKSNKRTKQIKHALMG